ncbi:AKR2A [Symbiodinium natans]|uniref:AKR2A protein n=1 Tax=Symbiodinium natans TaxID=878477 RepID=A0A812PB90_9DINO|nr:AKR2A [Symbiodinium natans]
MGDKEWQDTKKYLEANPEEARRMETFSRDAKAVRAWMQTQAITEYYNTRLSNGDEVVTNKFNALEKNPELAAIFEDIKRGGNQAAMQHYHNEPLMLKISRAMGGVPDEVKTVIQDIQSKPITLQEACLRGDMKTLEDYLEATAGDQEKRNIDEKDAKGISCLAYAIGANRTQVVKKLLESKANPAEVDNSGGNAIHYVPGRVWTLFQASFGVFVVWRCFERGSFTVLRGLAKPLQPKIFSSAFSERVFLQVPCKSARKRMEAPKNI